jgi:hypothetical protein
LALVVLLIVPGTQLNPADPEAASLVGNPSDDGVLGLRELTAAHISPGVLEPLIVVGENGPTSSDMHSVVTRLDRTRA